MGFPNYVKRFIPIHSTLNTLTEPLRELLQKKVDFDWNETYNKIYIENIGYTDADRQR